MLIRNLAVFNYRRSKDGFRRIAIDHETGPYRQESIWCIDTQVYGKEHHNNTYAEDVFTLMHQNQLPDVHEYIIYQMHAWPAFRSAFVNHAHAQFEQNMKYGIGDGLYQDGKYYIMEWIAPNDGRAYLEGYRESLALYGGRQIKVNESLESGTVAFEEDVWYFGNHEDSFVCHFHTAEDQLQNNGLNLLLRLSLHRCQELIKDTYRTAFRTSLNPLKVCNVGEIYTKIVDVPESILEKLKNTQHQNVEWRQKGSKHKTEIEEDDIVDLFGSNYFSVPMLSYLCCNICRCLIARKISI